MLPPSDTLDRGTTAATLHAQLATLYAERIRRGALTPGMRLPSVRDSARRHAVSPATVVAAYDLLQAQGLVEARRQRGFFVRAATGAAQAPATAAAVPATLAAPVDATALIRGMFQTRADGSRVSGPGLGTLPEPWLDRALLDRALRRAAAQGADALHYGDPAGDPGLRDALVRRLGGELGIACTPAQVVTTLGATHALDLVARTVLRPGDAVLIDEPGWAVEFARLSRMGMRLLPVPRGVDGPDLAVMARLAAEHAPRLYVTTAVLHNPTGHTLTLGTAHQILQLAEAHDLLVVEDDTYTWLAPPHAPRLSALDGLRRTVYVSGFSKILAPNWRVGHLAAAPELAERLIDTKLLSALTTPALLERAVAGCLEQGLLRRHAERVVQRLDGARRQAVRLAEAAGCRPLTPPQGLFGWLDIGVDADTLAARLAAQGWLTAPGSLFHTRPGGGRQAMRINHACAQDEAFWRAFRQTRDALARARA
ncbi:PLP-dependent aminotransferase family protein [Pseudaquabacterium rugosum]|uniref:PLP-dependent aminotransferase family protein n=1 Tax=Pseudaquabacterium rugosum TaxID=2984194 RepID=A0ABU9BBU1_9BURK